MGKIFAFPAEIMADPTQTAEHKLVLLQNNAMAAGSQRLLDMPLEAKGAVRFVPGESAVAYVVSDKDVDNIWLQKLDGSTPRQITNFTAGHIDDFHFSPDAKTLAVLHVDTSADVVLLRESKS